MTSLFQDYFTVAIDCKYEEAKTKSGIILLNTAYVDDQDMDRYAVKRLYGTVLSVPSVYNHTPVRAVDEGKPTYRKYVGHDDIVERINRGYRNHAEKSYCPSTFEAYKVVTLADIAKDIDARVGDIVYFTPQTTEPENLIDKHEGKEVYQVIASDVFCVVRDTEIIMQGEWVLVKPSMETWEDITTPAGVIKKPHPEARYLEGTIAHARHLSKGARILYVPDANCEIKVNDELYYVMPEYDVLGELE